MTLLLGLTLITGCSQEPEPVGPAMGGANTNDRTNTVDGERMRPGTLSVSAKGRFVVLHDAKTTTLVDVEHDQRVVRDERWDRVVFGVDEDQHEIAYVSRPGYDGISAIDLDTNQEKWSLLPAYYNEAGAQFFRLSADGATLLVGDVYRVFRIATRDGDIRGTSTIGKFPWFASVSPTGKRLFVVSETTWASDTEPSTPFSSVILETGESFTIEVPNCAAPLVALPDDSRVLFSPTFCARGASYPQSGRPLCVGVDPVSVIDVDLASSRPTFRRNLPGFGPVSLSSDGKQRWPSSTPRGSTRSSSTIRVRSRARARAATTSCGSNPRAERFELQPIGSDLPRFAFSSDGRSLWSTRR